MMRQGVLRICFALALVVVPRESWPYVRATTGSGACLGWSKRTIPYIINDLTNHGPRQVCGAPTSNLEAMTAAVRAGFDAWAHAGSTASSGACTDLQLIDQGTTCSTETGNDGRNLVIFRNGICSEVAPSCTNDCADTYNCWAHSSGSAGEIIAVTTVTYRTSNGEIVDADIEFNAWNGSTVDPHGSYFTCVPSPAEGGGAPCACQTPPYGQSNCIDMDVQNTAAHEVGHFLGLNHAADPGTTMYPMTPRFETRKRDLSPDDVAGVCAIYPAGTPMQGCASSDLRIQPTAPSARPGESISFATASAEPARWYLTTNGSGGSIDGETGVYIAGDAANVVDVVYAVDLDGHTATTVVTIVDTPRGATPGSAVVSGCSTMGGLDALSASIALLVLVRWFPLLSRRSLAPREITVSADPFRPTLRKRAGMDRVVHFAGHILRHHRSPRSHT